MPRVAPRKDAIVLHIHQALEAARDALTAPARLVVKLDAQGMIQADHSPYAHELALIETAIAEWRLFGAGLPVLIKNQRAPAELPEGGQGAGTPDDSAHFD